MYVYIYTTIERTQYVQYVVAISQTYKTFHFNTTKVQLVMIEKNVLTKSFWSVQLFIN